MTLFENSYRSFRTKHLQNKKNATEIEEDKYHFDSEVLLKSPPPLFLDFWASMSLFLQGTFLLLDLLKKSNSTKKQIIICFSSHYNHSLTTKPLDLKYLEAIEEMLNFASVTNV